MDHNRVTSYPVGYVSYLEMTARDFEEFLWAMHVGDDIIEYIMEHFESLAPVEEVLNDRFMQLFRQKSLKRKDAIGPYRLS